jgi:hypothetical protein
MGRHDGNQHPSTRPLSTPPDVSDVDTSWDRDALPPPLPKRHLGEPSPSVLPAASYPPGPGPKVESVPPGSDLYLTLDDPLAESSPLELADRNTPRSPLPEPPPDRYPAEELADTAAPPPRTEAETTEEMKERYAAGDFSGALALAEQLLYESPEHAEALRHGQSCRAILTQMYSSRFGSLAGVPRVAVPPDQIRWLSLDHRSGFLLSLVDGASRVEDILDVCGMARLDALRLLVALLEQRVISME